MSISDEYFLFASFNKCSITPFEGASTYMTLNILSSHINAYAALVHCDLGDVNLGCIVLTAPPSTSTLLSTLHFVEPTNVGPTIAMPDPEPRAVVILGFFRTNKEKIRIWREYNDVDRAIKRVIKTIVPEVYFRILRNRHMG